MGTPLKVFISYAHEDSAFKEQLLKQLSGLSRQGLLDVWEDSKIAAGEAWLENIEQALAECHTALLLVSADFLASAFIHEKELPALFERRQNQGLKLVPLIIRACDWQSLPFGDLQALPTEGRPIINYAVETGERDSIWADVAREVRIWCEAARAAERTLAKPQPAVAQETGSTLQVGVVREALLLDRTDQWQTVIDRVRAARSTLFYLHGERRQNLDLFIARVWQFLNQKSDIFHQKFQVPFVFEYHKPSSPEAWELRMRTALGGRGLVEDLLADASLRYPVLFSLGEFPIGKDDLEVERTDDLVTGLERFLSDRLPELMANSADQHPVHALLAVHYENEEDSLRGRLEAAAVKGTEKHGIVFQEIELTPVTWDHVKHYLNQLHAGKPPQEVAEKLRAIYQSLDHSTVSFEELARRIGRELPQSIDDT